MAARKSNKASYLSGIKRRSNSSRRKANTSRRRTNSRSAVSRRANPGHGTKKGMRRKTSRRAYMKRRPNAAKGIADTKVLGMRVGSATSAAAAAGIGALAAESVANFLDFQLISKLPHWARALGMAGATIGVVAGGVYIGNRIAPGGLKQSVPYATGAMAAPLAIRTADALMGLFRGARPAPIAASRSNGNGVQLNAELVAGEGTAQVPATAAGTIVETYGMSGHGYDHHSMSGHGYDHHSMSGSLQSGSILPMGRGRKRLLA